MIHVHVAAGRSIKSVVESREEKIGVSQKAILYREDGTILMIRRSKTAPSRPLWWDLPGGELEFGEDTIAGIIREVKEETGLEIQNPELFDVISDFNDKGEFWVTICYKAKPVATNVVLSFEHDDYQWIRPEEFQEFQASPRNKKFVEKFKKCCGA